MNQKFKLVSRFKPAGDQPQTIEKLIRGLNEKKQFQTLLGVTGSGKSVVGDTLILVNRRQKVTTEKIGTFIDRIYAEFPQLIRSLSDREIIPTRRLPKHLQLTTYSFDPVTKKSSWKTVTHLTRHRAPHDLFRVKTSCGREIIATGDHNFFVLRNGELALTPTTALSQKDYLPIPLSIKNKNNGTSSLYLPDYVPHPHQLYVHTPSFSLVWREHKSRIKQILSYSKIYRIIHFQERTPFDIFKKISATDHRIIAGATIGLNKLKSQLPLRLPIDSAFLRFLGYYIAEGHADDKYFILSSGDEEIIRDFTTYLSRLKLRWRKRPGTYDYQISSGLCSQLLKTMCGGIAQEKKLPPFWFDLSDDQLSEILKTYFSADGGVEHSEVTCTTASRQLASDLSYALSRFGIVARIRQRLISLPKKQKRNTYWTIKISGQSALTIFQKHIGFVITQKKEALKSVLGKNPNTNVDIIPINGAWIRKARKELKLSQKQIARAIGTTRPLISLYEDNRRKPSRECFRQLVLFFQRAGRQSKQYSLLNEINQKKSFLRLFWSPVKEIKKAAREKYVYDFSVEGTETFLAGIGGIFVHNTFTMANVIANIQKPTLVISHNKTLAAQLAEEFQEFFPENEVHYFVSYYDYYQPEAYIPSSDTYIEKETQVNEEIDRLRHAATQALLSRRDVIVVASVSCIYGLGSPEEYARQFFTLHIKDSLTPRDVMKKLVNLQYQRNDIDPKRGMFRCVGGNIDILQPFSAHTFDRVVFGTAGIGEFKKIDRTTGKTIGESSKTLAVFPATHYLTPRERLTEILEQIEDDMHAEVKALKKTNKILEAARLEQRTTFDLEMIRSVGYCSGIENYSRYFDNRQPSEPAFTLIDYFPSSANPAVVAKATLAESAASAGGPKDFLTFIDESHMTIPQINAMYNGDRARKDQLVQYGFRLKAAYDNRPLKFEEFEKKLSQTIFVSATPGAYEMSKCRIMDISTCRNFEISKPSLVVEQIIRPTGLLDPVIEVHPTENQIDNLIKEIQARIQKHQRVLVTTLTKRMAEDLASHLSDLGMKVAYIHSEIETFDRLEIIEKLRSGFYDCLVGINLLREGLDLPEVSLVAILDADKEGFLRSRTAFLQIAGRASRHLEGKVIMYADKETRSMKETIEETERRRRVQMEYNQKHGITPQSIKKGIRKGILAEVQKKEEQEKDQKAFLELVLTISGIEAESLARELQSEMELASKNWEFEKAAHLRDRIRMLREKTAKRPLGKFGRLKQLAQEK